MSARNYTTCPRCRDPETLREDYEVGVSVGGVFFASYRATCQGCPFKFEFRHEQGTAANVAAVVRPETPGTNAGRG